MHFINICRDIIRFFIAMLLLLKHIVCNDKYRYISNAQLCYNFTGIVRNKIYERKVKNLVNLY